MKVLIINLDKTVFREPSPNRQRLADYSHLVDKLFVIVLTRGRQQAVISDDHLSVYPTNSCCRFNYLFDTWRLAHQILKKEKIDLVVTQDPFETGFLGWLIAKIYALPLQLQIHTDFLSPYFKAESFLNKIRMVLAKFLISRAALIRVVSQRIKKSLLVLGVKERKFLFCRFGLT